MCLSSSKPVGERTMFNSGTLYHNKITSLVEMLLRSDQLYC